MRKNVALILFAIWGFSMIGLFCLNIYRDFPNEKSSFLAQGIIKFSNPTLAYKVLTQLEAPNRPSGSKDGAGFGLKHDNKYCEKRLAYFVTHPETVFNEMNFVANVKNISVVRTTIIPDLGRELHPEVGPHMPALDKKNPKDFLSTEAGLFYTSIGMFANMVIGKHYSCLSQISNHLPGVDPLENKNRIPKTALAYAKKFEDRPQCFDHDKAFPKTWVLFEKDECEDFFKIINTKEYERLKKERGVIYLRKLLASHRGEGVEPLDETEETKLKKIYENGAKCGEEKRRYIIQDFIPNPLLINGKKFDFRMYMFIASTNPLIAYYHDGYLRVSLGQYSGDSEDNRVLLTNLALNYEIYRDAKQGILYKGMDEEQLKLAQQWEYDRFQNYLMEKKIISDPNWLDNYLRPAFKKLMIHLLRMSSYSFKKHSSLYELHGVDFMLDDTLNVWFIESNASPAVSGGFSAPMEKFLIKMLKDHFKLVFGLLRSRMKRVVLFVNELIKTGEVEELVDGSVFIKKFDEKRAEFERITKNYFDKEFEPSDDNGFSLILDGNLEGEDRYQGLVSKECL